MKNKHCFSEFRCKQCGKKVVTIVDLSVWAYKVHHRYFCSWTCLCEYRRNKSDNVRGAYRSKWSDEERETIKECISLGMSDGDIIKKVWTINPNRSSSAIVQRIRKEKRNTFTLDEWMDEKFRGSEVILFEDIDGNTEITLIGE